MGITTVTDEAAPLLVRQSRWQCAKEVLLILAVFFVAAGDPPPHVNEAHYLCRLKHYWNPTWCAGDLFLESTDTQLVFIWLFGWLTRFISLTATAWIGRVVAWTAIAWAWQRLSWRVVPRRFAAVLSAALFIGLNYYLNMAGEWVVGGVEAKCFAYALVLWALHEMLDDRWNRVWLLLGAATAFHPLVGGWSGIVCAGIWLMDGWHEGSRHPHPALSQRERVIKMLPGLVGGGLLGLIGVVPALMLTWSAPPDVVAEANRIYVFDRLPHHLAPLTLPTAEVTRRFRGHAVLLLGLVVLAWIERGWGGAQRPSSALGARALASPRHVIDAYSFPNRGLWRLVLFAFGAVLLAMIGLTIELTLQNNPDLAAKLLKYYWFRLTDFAAAMAVALQLTTLVAMGFERRRAWAAPALVASMIFGAWYPVTACWQRVENPIPPAESKIADDPAWVEVCNWVAANTPPDSLFITPRLCLTFKWRTGQPQVVSRKDIPQDAADIVAWHDRLKDIYTVQFGGVDQSVDSVGALGDGRVRELAKKYLAKYVLSDRGQLLSLPIVFRNEEYVVYRITEENADRGR